LQLGKEHLNLPTHGSVQSGIKLFDAESQHRTWCLTTILRPMRLGSLGSRSFLERGQADNQSTLYNKPKTSLNVYYIFVALAADGMQPLVIVSIQNPLRSVKLVHARLNKPHGHPPPSHFETLFFPCRVGKVLTGLGTLCPSPAAALPLTEPYKQFSHIRLFSSTSEADSTFDMDSVQL
jgi:hypothetical protein